MSTSRIFGLTRLLTLSVALVGLLILPGCGIFSPDESKDCVDCGKPVEYADPTDQDILIENFLKAWQNRDFDAYDRLRHSEFLFEFATADIALSDTPNGIWQRSKDSESVFNMFDGRPGKDTPAVQSIDLKLFPQSSVWSPATEAGFEGTSKRTYAVEMTVILTNADRFIVTGLQDFYAINISENPSKDEWQLYYWRDQGLDASKGALALR